ncbi:MAG: DegT/DnrJ/EryC1/StrS family aminotransferase [Deltaproteobacteria bacterium]|nr:DegT/DnrJ/EryC1/StrS family aminotransferase [Deltaproteobacteria bacterium]
MIPVCEPLVSKREEKLLVDCLRSGWISSSGKFLERFETEWAKYCGMKHGIAVSSGTAALSIAARLLDLKPHDEVIMPAFTIISCAQAIVECGGVPVLVDSDPVNWQMDVSQIRQKITHRTRAIMVVHIYGHPADMEPVLDIADEFGLNVVEDAAEAHGAEYRGRKCGGMGDVSVFSFYANKLITTGEGGMVLTQRDDLCEKARALRNLCFQKSRRFYHEDLGYNFRMTNIQAALGVGQLERIEQIVDRKRAIAMAYQERLGGVKGIVLPVEEEWAKNIYWVYGIVLDDSTDMDAAQFAECLAEVGIDTRPFFLGMHEQPVFQKMGLFNDNHFPVAERLSRQGLYLPTGLSIKESEINRVCKAVELCLA